MTLEIRNLDVSISNIPILRDVSLSVPSGKMFGLIGHNGAGKTTLMRAIMGLLDADQGTITFDGQDLRKMADFARAKTGISYMPEDRRLIPSLTVEENILLPAWTNGIADADERLKWVYDLLPEIAQFRDRRALQLSGGQQKLVSLGRALMPGRNLLLLDEPFEGVAPVLSRRLSEVISDLGSSGLCVLISESDDSHSADLVAGSYRIERGTVSKAELKTA